jgi:hypothetical protein
MLKVAVVMMVANRLALPLFSCQVQSYQKILGQAYFLAYDGLLLLLFPIWLSYLSITKAY